MDIQNLKLWVLQVVTFTISQVAISILVLQLNSSLTTSSKMLQENLLTTHLQ